jgi:hypothetical protein
MKQLTTAIAMLLLTSSSHAQSLAPLFPSKEYIQLNGEAVAIENAIVPDVANDSFESGNYSSWTDWNGSNVSVTTSIAHSGSYSLMVTGPNNTGAFQDIGGLTPGQQYVVSAWVDVTAGAMAELYLDDTVSPSTTQIASQGQTDGWQFISLPFTADSTGKLRIHLWFAGTSGTIYWDDVAVVKAIPVGNYGFESGNLSSWPESWGGPDVAVTSSIAHSGSYSLAQTGPNNTGIAQDIGGLVSGQQYVASAWVNVSAGATALLYLDDTVSTATTEIAYQGQTNGWQYISLPFTVDSTGSIRIHLWFYGSGTIYWDDVSLVAAIPVGNYGFESGNLSFWPESWGGPDVAVTSSIAHSGSYSLAQTGPNNTGIAQDIGALAPGQQYVASAWVNVGAGATAFLLLDDTTPNNNAGMMQGQTNGWQMLSVPLTASSTGVIRIHLWFYGSGTVYWDDISLEP